MIAAEGLAEYLDAAGLGSGEPTLKPIGEGHSNLTYLVEHGAERFVLRRPPLGELSASANDVVREARVLSTLGGTELPVPEVLAICEDPEVIGAPFFLAEFVPGHVLTTRLPQGWDAATAGRAAGGAIAALAALHRIDLKASGLDAFGAPSGYLERQLRRFSGLLEQNATRPLPQLERVATWLDDNLPPSRAVAFVHGDYRLGNLILGEEGGVTAILDWEMATTGDPLADLGYMTATWARPDDAPNPLLELSAVALLPGFPGREELAARYAELTELPLDDLPWYQVLALWKSAIFLEGSYRRYRRGDSDDPFFARLGEGVPALAEAALEWSQRA